MVRSTALREQIPRCRKQFLVGHNPSHQTPVEGFGRAQHAAGEHKIAGAYRPDETDKHLAVVGVGVATNNSGTRNVARSLTTDRSLHKAICRPPP